MESKQSYGACPHPATATATGTARRTTRRPPCPSLPFALFIAVFLYLTVWSPLGYFNGRKPEKPLTSVVDDPMNPWENVSLLTPSPTSP